ncbi:claudin-1-like [Synchiropus splendidus]|uniref:claudin-1-like n=1 Tax=Synchiropus splendidus TaxID=270530 RepID=UPI00237E8179|nr:claudin-1-like [Synchiropus splendidus]
MASSGLQLLGFCLAVTGLAATGAATFMVEWKRQSQGAHRMNQGLWMKCSGSHRTTCEIYESLLKLPSEVQVTSAVMLLSILISTLALVVSTVGMKCTRFMEQRVKTKSTVASIGGIMFIVSGLLTVIITSWYVNKIVQSFHKSQDILRYEFGKAVFVSWAGGLLTVAGGMFLSCRRCTRSSSGSISSNQLISNGSNYV